MPAFSEPLTVGRPNIGDEEQFLHRLRQAFRLGRLSNNGPFVQELEARLQDLLQVRHCVVTCNATAAISLLAHALGLTGEIIMPAFTFIATAHAFRWHGLDPVFCDIVASTHNADPEDVERLITPRTSAIVGVHVWGRPCDVDSLRSIAKRHGVHLIFDAAHALGCTAHGRPIGSFGEAEVFSLHATKCVNAFEGGIISTNDGHLAERLRALRTFGMTADGIRGVGINAKMAEVSAAMGLTNLDAFPTFRHLSYRNYQHYQRRLDGWPGIHVCRYDDAHDANYHYVVIEVDAATSGLSRDDLLWLLTTENILAKPYFAPGCHRLEPYCSEPVTRRRRLPATERVCDRVLVLPNGASVTTTDVQIVCEVIATALEHAEALKARRQALGAPTAS